MSYRVYQHQTTHLTDTSITVFHVENTRFVHEFHLTMVETAHGETSVVLPKSGGIIDLETFQEKRPQLSKVIVEYMLEKF